MFKIKKLIAVSLCVATSWASIYGNQNLPYRPEATNLKKLFQAQTISSAELFFTSGGSSFDSRLSESLLSLTGKLTHAKQLTLVRIRGTAFGLVPYTWYGKAFIAALQGPQFLREEALKGQLDFLKNTGEGAFLMALGGKAAELKEVIAFVIGPREETKHYFAEPLLKFVSTLPLNIPLPDDAARTLARGMIELWVHVMTQDHRIALINGEKMARPLNAGELELLRREILSWAEPIEKFLYWHLRTLSPGDEWNKKFADAMKRFTQSHADYHRMLLSTSHKNPLALAIILRAA